METDKFVSFIESIGFTHKHSNAYWYNNYTIFLYTYEYSIYSSNELAFGNISKDYDDLKLLNKIFKKEIRKNKLKKLLK